MRFAAIVVVVSVCMISLTFPQNAEAQYAISRSVFGNGGTTVVGSGYIIKGTLGQPVVGKSIGASNIVYAGFWYESGSVGPTLLTLNLFMGWNMISFPGDPVDPDVADIVAGTPVLPFFYTSCGGAYVPMSTVEFGKGYWVASPVDYLITIYYLPRVVGDIPVCLGWSMVGSVDCVLPVSSLTSNPPCHLPFIYTWDSGGYVPVTNLEPGLGYWAAATCPTILTMDCAIPPSPMTMPLAEASASWEGAITADNATSGASQLLTFGADQNATDDFDISFDVPVPPRGQSPISLDAAFLSTGALSRLSKDIKQEADVNQRELSVFSETGDVTLTWDVSGVPSDRTMILRTDSQVIDMQEVSSLSLEIDQEHHLTLEVVVVAAEAPVVDVTGVTQVDRFGTRLDRSTGQLSMMVTWTNVSDDQLSEPLHLVIENITPPVATVENADGVTADGKPYFDYSSLVEDGKLDAGETSEAKQLIFSTPGRARLEFDVSCWAVVDSEASAAPPDQSHIVRAHRIHIVIPAESSLAQNYPNPFNPETWIPYELSESCSVEIHIYDVSGRLVRSLDVGYREIGQYISKVRAAYWDGRSQSGEQVVSGIYFYTIQAGDYTATRKMVVAR